MYSSSSCATEVTQIRHYLRSGIGMVRHWTELLPRELPSLLDEAILEDIPLWVHFPNLLFKYWSKEILSRLVITLGKPLTVTIVLMEKVL